MSGYDVRESTGDPSDPTIDTVVTHALERASNPRDDVHVDRYLADAVERFGKARVAWCIRLILSEGFTHRGAGRKAFGSTDWGINVGSAVSTYLHREFSPSDASITGLVDEADAEYEAEVYEELEYEDPE